MSSSASLDYDFLSGSTVGYYINIIKNTPKGNAESNRKLIQEYQSSDDPIARELLIKTNLGLVLTMAKKYKDTAHSFEFIDIIQEGIFGLIRLSKHLILIMELIFLPMLVQSLKTVLRPL